MGDQLEENSWLDDNVSELKAAIQEKENEIAKLNVKQSQQDTNMDRRCTSASQLTKALKENSDIKTRLVYEIKGHTCCTS